mmetsp:Transcript_102046/g.173010  ORF Transcript_102046/g.173010 Transcript_102046/m.173010 type:complete len:319 (+) Transcript_102046:488-1444(+)|eukprot:CAMPEP_0174369546 /NCGR_PEP_ID=MMETSP0811_2-20130205/92878_1 /TAXON_ID=73025 ORGANISM="Eutreptiella gymnastica-like, Strain CCMP1594" /NCGR_SAMPLE_ID=MMETSP0811_2 /ASSEMBLY_ACC=CAM_ASM_000667 /LENGTH=318 /DNA_ID=CAMNT_0015514093 /DNA_START=457 /DNA_END=1413 /DNA_ORIENTATION=-
MPLTQRLRVARARAESAARPSGGGQAVVLVELLFELVEFHCVGLLGHPPLMELPEHLQLMLGKGDYRRMLQEDVDRRRGLGQQLLSVLRITRDPVEHAVQPPFLGSGQDVAGEVDAGDRVRVPGVGAGHVMGLPRHFVYERPVLVADVQQHDQRQQPAPAEVGGRVGALEAQVLPLLPHAGVQADVRVRPGPELIQQVLVQRRGAVVVHVPDGPQDRDRGLGVADLLEAVAEVLLERGVGDALGPRDLAGRVHNVLAPGLIVLQVIPRLQELLHPRRHVSGVHSVQDEAQRPLSAVDAVRQARRPEEGRTGQQRPLRP